MHELTNWVSNTLNGCAGYSQQVSGLLNKLWIRNAFWFSGMLALMGGGVQEMCYYYYFFLRGPSGKVLRRVLWQLLLIYNLPKGGLSCCRPIHGRGGMPAGWELRSRYG